ncbi:MAG: hypothetical protein D3910_08985 [Candidatus Electrothrix sp. ATG2]|nr:hypothetical protein [Candidatus Electrothrix sp. ATG2]
MNILSHQNNLSSRQLFFNASAMILLLFILLRWFFLIDRYSINMLFWDQWDFLGALFADKGPWELFSWQHGPHRQGVGFFLTEAVANLSGWNTRVESFMIGAVVCLAALTAVFLKFRLAGKMTALDVIIPLCYLSPLQFGLVANTPNVSHGAMPLLLITLFCLCWTIKNITLRYLLCAIINFMTIYTGFGVFLGCITPLLFLSELVIALKYPFRPTGPERQTTKNGRVARTDYPALLCKNKKAGKPLHALFFFMVSLVSVFSFFVDYTFSPAAKGFVFPHPEPFMYIEYILITFAAFCGIRGSHIVSIIAGVPILCCVIYLAVKAGGDIVHKVSTGTMGDKIALGQIVLVLVTFTLLFSLNLAVGRVCLGLETATAPRYTPYMVPAFFALYLFAVTREWVPVRQIVFCATCFFITTFSVGDHNRAYAERFCQGKLQWKEAYLETENILSANRLSGFEIHPNPQATRLQGKLDYLKKNKLNLFLTGLEP